METEGNALVITPGQMHKQKPSMVEPGVRVTLLLAHSDFWCSKMKETGKTTFNSEIFYVL